MSCSTDVLVRGGCTLALLLVAAHVAAGDGGASKVDVKAELGRMTEALRTLTYSGTFVYLHGNKLDTLRISHTVRNGQELEQLASLNGAAREVQQDPEGVTCVMPDSQSISVQRHAGPTQLWPSLDLARLDRLYVLHALGTYRVAGRATQVVGIIPRDRMRYGYRFYLDRRSGLPLKTDLMSEDAKPVEQIMFTSLELGAEGGLAGGGAARWGGYGRVVREAPQEDAAQGAASAWELEGLPTGFTLRRHHHWRDASGAPVEQLVVSDGLASVSVYVEKGDGDGLQGPAHVGAVHAWGGHVAGHQVTAVGEVPSATVRRVAEALRARPRPPEEQR
jgi:sigma-E factor negative regulatory protein RseB